MQCHLILYSISAVFIPQSLQQVDLWLLLFWWLSILTQNLPLFIQSCLTVQGCSAISVFPDGLREKQGSVWSQHRKIPEARGCIAIGIVHAQYMLIPVVTMEMAWLLHRLLCCLHSCNRSFGGCMGTATHAFSVFHKHYRANRLLFSLCLDQAC